MENSIHTFDVQKCWDTDTAPNLNGGNRFEHTTHFLRYRRTVFFARRPINLSSTPFGKREEGQDIPVLSIFVSLIYRALLLLLIFSPYPFFRSTRYRFQPNKHKSEKQKQQGLRVKKNCYTLTVTTVYIVSRSTHATSRLISVPEQKKLLKLHPNGVFDHKKSKKCHIVRS